MLCNYKEYRVFMETISGNRFQSAVMSILAEFLHEMCQFKNTAQRVNGLDCPGSDESAGKVQSTITKGGKLLLTASLRVLGSG